MRFLKYSGYEQHDTNNIDQSTVMRHSAQQFLLNNNNNNSNNNNNHGEKFHNASNVKHKRISHSEKVAKPIKYYNFPLMFERPLDMRRCADGAGDDSGESRTTHVLTPLFVW